MERQVTEIAVVAENGNLKPLCQLKLVQKLPCRSSFHLELVTTPQEVASVWRHHFAKDFDHRIKTVPFENLANSLQEIQTQVQNCDTGESTLVTPACDRTQQDEAACDPIAQVEQCFLDWVDELSQVAGTTRSARQSVGNFETSGQLQSIS